MRGNQCKERNVDKLLFFSLSTAILFSDVVQNDTYILA